MEAAFILPRHSSRSPEGTSGATCRPATASTGGSRRQPSAIIRSAPPTVSSDGWKKNFTAPENSDSISFSILAEPSATAVCMSWPHACITPSFADLKGTSASSFTGRASMSALIPTPLNRRSPWGGFLPSIHATIPFPATPHLCSMPHRLRYPLIFSAVRTSCSDSSGCMCRSLLISTVSS